MLNGYSVAVGFCLRYTYQKDLFLHMHIARHSLSSIDLFLHMHAFVKVYYRKLLR